MLANKEERVSLSGCSYSDYFSKPNAEEVFDKIYDLMAEVEPDKFPDIY